MVEISPQSLKLLKKIKHLGHLPADKISNKIDVNRLQHLVKKGLLTVITLIPPGKEGYEMGLVGYQLSPEGEDAIYNHFKTKLESRIALIISILSLLVATAGAFLPIDEWIKSLF